MRGTPSRATAITAGLTLGLSLAIGLVTATPAQAARDWEKSAMYVPQAQALSKTQGEGVTIAIISTGVDGTHPALKGKVTQGPDLAEGGLGKGDKGWGVTGTSMAYDALKTAPKAKILSIKASLEDADSEKHKDGGKYDDKKAPTASAIAYAVDKGGADVIAMSTGEEYTDFGGSTIMAEERSAVAYAISKGVPVVAATGDDGASSDDNKVTYPAAHAGVIAVAATGPGGTRAPFSTVHAHTDVAAPGVGIFSAVPGGQGMAKGTAQSAALVSGVVALMKSKNPEITPAEVRAVLRGTAQHPPGGRNALVGYGQVNAYKAVHAAAGPPKTLKEAPPYEGKANLGTPDGAERVTSLPWGFGLKAGIGVAGLLGVVLLGLGVLRLLRRGKSPQPAAVPGAMPPGSMPGGPGAMPPGPGGHPQPGPGPQGRPPYGGQPYGGPPYGGPPAGPPQG